MQLYVSPSEIWMHRMLEQLGSSVGLVAAGRIGDRKETEFGQPLIELFRTQWRRGLFTRLGLPWVNQRIGPLRKAIKSRHITHVLCHYGPVALSLESLWTPDLDVWVHFHGFDAMFEMMHEEPPHRPWHRPDYKDRLIALSKKVRFIANSEFLASKLKEAGVAPDRIRVKTLGVKIDPAPKVHTAQETTKFVTLGRLISCKGAELTVAAFCRACDLGLNGELTLIGAGPMMDACKEVRDASKWADRVHLVGALPNDEAMEIVRAADVYTQHNIKSKLTGQEEAFGVSIIEGMAVGLPTITTLNGGVAEIVVPDETGLVMEPYDIEAQAQHMLTLARDPELRNRLGRAGWERAREKFSLEEEGRKLRAIFGLTEE